MIRRRNKFSYSVNLLNKNVSCVHIPERDPFHSTLFLCLSCINVPNIAVHTKFSLRFIQLPRKRLPRPFTYCCSLDVIKNVFYYKRDKIQHFKYLSIDSFSSSCVRLRVRDIKNIVLVPVCIKPYILLFDRQFGVRFIAFLSPPVLVSVDTRPEHKLVN